MNLLLRTSAILSLVFVCASLPAQAQDDAVAFLKQLGPAEITKQKDQVVVHFTDGTVVVVCNGRIATTTNSNGDQFISRAGHDQLAIKPHGQKLIPYSQIERSALIGSDIDAVGSY